MITNLIRRHAGEIAKIHLNSLPGDFLPSLGIDFLEVFYRGLIGKPGVFGFSAIEKGKVRGFVIGTKNMQGTFKSVIKSEFASLFTKVVLQLIKRPLLIKNILETFLYTKRDKGPKAELIIIAIDEASRGKGYGKKLVLALEDKMRKMKIKDYKVTVTARNKKANEFYKNTGFDLSSHFSLYNKDWNVYTKKI